MSEISELLDADAQNVRHTKELFRNFSPELFGTLDEAASLFRTTLRIFGQGCSDADAVDKAIINKYGSELGIVDSEEMDQLLNSTFPEYSNRSEFLIEIINARDRIRSRPLRAYILIQIFRAYMWAVTDLLRLRITPAHGYLRLQIEGVALLGIMRNRPEVAWEWKDVGLGKEGTRFFRNYQTKIKEFVKSNDFEFAYNYASGTAQHIRFSSAIRRFSISKEQVPERGEVLEHYEVGFQEADLDNPAKLISDTLFFLWIQYLIFISLTKVLPELEDPILINTRIPNFGDKISRLRGLLKKMFPDQVNQWEA